MVISLEGPLTGRFTITDLENSIVARMTARALLTCRPNSHPFQERCLTLDQPVKVGRSVARARPAPNNSIFDCKVLSRNHASVWYENGKFYLQDTKSSNGTFVNNQRLSKAGEESAPREICSGDIVQFGVDVMENSRKVTHGCIVATLRLYLPDGKEAKASPSSSMTLQSNINMQDLYQMHQYLQEATHREQQLENKLSALKRLLQASAEAVNGGWKAMVDEDQLLTRLELLENQLQSYAKNMNEDKLQEELLRLQAEKDLYQVKAKESLKQVLSDKIEVMKKLQDVERDMSNTNDEHRHLKEIHNKSKKDLQDLSDKYDEKMKVIQELEAKLQDTLASQKDSTSASEIEQQHMQRLIDELTQKELSLMAKIESLLSSNETKKDQLLCLKSRLKQYKEEEMILPDDDIDHILNDIEENNLKNCSKIEYEDVDTLRKQLLETESELERTRKEVSQLHMQIEEMQDDFKQDNPMNTATDKNDSDEDEDDTPDDVVNRDDVINYYARTPEDTLDTPTIRYDDISSLPPSIIYGSPTMGRMAVEGREASPNRSVTGDELSKDFESAATLRLEISHLKVLLEEAKKNALQANNQSDLYKHNADELSQECRTMHDELEVAKQHLNTAQDQLNNKNSIVLALQEQYSTIEGEMGDLNGQLSQFQERLTAEKQKVAEQQKDIDYLKQQNMEAQQNSKQMHNEMEKLKSKVRFLSEELQLAQGVRCAGDLPNNTSDDSRTAEDCQRLREECSNLRIKVNDLETENKMLKGDKIQLVHNYKTLSDSYVELEAVKDRLNLDHDVSATVEGDNISLGPSPSEVNAKALEAKLRDSENEVVALRESYAKSNEQQVQLRRRLQTVEEERNQIGHQITMATACSVVPLIMLVIAMIAAFYPTISLYTATSEPKPPID